MNLYCFQTFFSSVKEETQIIVYWVKRVRTEGADVFASSPLAANVSPLCAVQSGYRLLDLNGQCNLAETILALGHVQL